MASSARGKCQVRNHSREAYLSNQNAEGESREDGKSILSGRTKAHLFSSSDFFVQEGPYGASEFLFSKLCLVGHESYHRDDTGSKCL